MSEFQVEVVNKIPEYSDSECAEQFELIVAHLQARINFIAETKEKESLQKEEYTTNKSTLQESVATAYPCGLKFSCGIESTF